MTSFAKHLVPMKKNFSSFFISSLNAGGLSYAKKSNSIPPVPSEMSFNVNFSPFNAPSGISASCKSSQALKLKELPLIVKLEAFTEVVRYLTVKTALI